MVRCFYCGKKIKEIDSIKYQLPEELYFDNISADVCSFDHLKTLTLKIEYILSHIKIFYISGFISLIIYLIFLMLLAEKWNRWIYLIFSLDWGISIIICPFLFTKPGTWVSLKYSIILHRVFAAVLIISGIIVCYKY